MSTLDWLYFHAKPINPETFQDLEPPTEEQRSLPFAIEMFKEMMNDPKELCCPISLSLFQDPVIDGVGHTYDRQSIQTHFKSQKDKNQSLTSPLSQEPLEDERLVPNRDKKSKIEQYKVEKSQRCFEMAKQSIEKKCGDTALMLIKRASYLIPSFEGLNEIEAVARKTFISARRQRIAHTFQAQELIENQKSEKALSVLRPLIERPVYTSLLSDPVVLPLLKSQFVAIAGKYLLIRRLEATPSPRGEYLIWDIEKNAQFDAFYLSQPVVKCILIKDVLLLYTNNKWPNFLYNLSTRNLKRIEGVVYPNPNETFKHRLDEINRTHKIYQYEGNNDDFGGTKIEGLTIDQKDNTTIINTKTDKVIGFVYSISCNLRYTKHTKEACNFVNDAENKETKEQHCTICNRRSTLKAKYSHYHAGNIFVRINNQVFHDKEFKKIDESLTTYVFLISDQGIKQLNADRQGWQLDEQGNFRITSQEEFLQAYFPQDTAQKHYPQVNPLSSEVHDSQIALPPGSVIRGIYRNRLIAGSERGEHKSMQKGDEEFSKYNLNHAYVVFNPEDRDFYKTVLKASILEGDFASYLRSMEHLVGFYHQLNKWDELEKWMSSLIENKDVILRQIDEAIEEAKRDGDEIGASRLYLYLGLLQNGLHLKQQAYQQAHKINPEDPATQSAISALQANQMPYQELLRITEEQREIIEKTQQEMRKLQELLAALQNQAALSKENSIK